MKLVSHHIKAISFRITAKQKALNIIIKTAILTTKLADDIEKRQVDTARDRL
jgi:hypothetical protein